MNRNIFSQISWFFEPRGTSLRAKGSLTEHERETRRDHVPQNWSFGFQIGPARSKSVLIEIRLLMENPWNGEAAASGVMTIDCARHNLKWPNGVGDIQLGEKYDHIFTTTALSDFLQVSPHRLRPCQNPVRHRLIMPCDFIWYCVSMAQEAWRTDEDLPSRGRSITQHPAHSLPRPQVPPSGTC